MRLEELASKYNLFLCPLPTIKTSTPIPTITPFRTSASTLFLATTLPATSPNNPILVNTTVCPVCNRDNVGKSFINDPATENRTFVNSSGQVISTTLAYGSNGSIVLSHVLIFFN